MNKWMILIAGCWCLAGCAEDSKSIEQKIDSIGDKLEPAAEKVWDSTKSKAKNLKEKIEEKVEEAKDSVKAKRERNR